MKTILLLFFTLFTVNKSFSQSTNIGVIASGYRIPSGLCVGLDNDGHAWDSDACTFITNTGITNSTQKTVINFISYKLKDSSLWALADAIYPFVGGSYTTNKYNLKDPRDLDAAFRLSFTGTWTFGSANGGPTPDGSTAYANSFWIPSVQSGVGKTASGGVYLLGDINGTYVDMGAKDGSNYYFQIFSSLGYNFYGQPNENNRTPETISNNVAPGSQGWFFINRTDTYNTYIQWNATQAAFSSGLSTDAQAPTVSVYFGAENVNGTATYFSPRTLAFGWLGKTLTTTQSNTLQGIVEAAQVKLTRSWTFQ